MSQSELVQPVEQALRDPSVEVLTGAAAIADARDREPVEQLGVPQHVPHDVRDRGAVVVGSFVIYNTFSITVAQRTKETALLRAIGAKRKQVMRTVMLEAILTGIVASAIGVVAGIGRRPRAAQSLLRRSVSSCRPAARSSNPSTIVISMVVGIVVTVVAAYLPGPEGGQGPADRGAARRLRATAATLDDAAP